MGTACDFICESLRVLRKFEFCICILVSDVIKYLYTFKYLQLYVPRLSEKLENMSNIFYFKTVGILNE